MKNRTVWWYVCDSAGEPIRWTKAASRARAMTNWDQEFPSHDPKLVAGVMKEFGMTVRRVTVEWEQ